MNNMNTETERLERYKKILLTLIHQHLPGCLVYLFGSRARGTNTQGADIDLALDMGAKIDPKLILKIYNSLEETTIPLTVDLIDLVSASDKLKAIVKHEGVLWTI